MTTTYDEAGIPGVEASEQDTQELVREHFNAENFADLLHLVPAQDDRERICAKITGAFDVPQPQEIDDRRFEFVLKVCRMKSDAIADAKDRDQKIDVLATAFDNAINGMAQIEEEPEIAPEVEPVKTVTRVSGKAPDIPFAPSRTPPESFAMPDEYISLLVPPPVARDVNAISKWITGTPADSASFALGFPNFDDASIEKVMEMEADLCASPSRIEKLYGANVVAATRNGSSTRIMNKMAMRVDILETSDADVLENFAAGVATAWSEFRPVGRVYLEYNGGTVRVGDALLPMLRMAHALEARWLDEMGDDTGGRPQTLFGNTDPDGEFNKGHVFARMAALHLNCGLHPADALLESLKETRFAMALRGTDPSQSAEIAVNFDHIFEDNCTQAASAYRFAKSEVIAEM